MSDLSIVGSTVHLPGCLWATRPRSRPLMVGESTDRSTITRSIHRQGLTPCPDCRPLDSLPTSTQQGAARG
jgi:hypothetical protein